MKFLKLSVAILIGWISLHLNLSTALAQDDVVAAAKKEGQLVLYLSTNLTDANGIVQLFKQKYPFINVNLFRADNEKLLNRILTETTSGKFNGDVIMISSFEVRVLLQKKLLQKYASPHSQAYPEGFTDKDGFGPAFTRFHGSSPTILNWFRRSSRRKPSTTCSIRAGRAASACPTARPSGTPAF